MDRRDFLLFRRRRKARAKPYYVLSCEWLYEKCLDTRLSPPASRDAAIFDEEAIRLVFDQLDDRLRETETVYVTQIEWLVGDIRKEFGNLMRSFRSRGGRVEVEKGQSPGF
jgi:hypothetical protein